MMNGSEQGNGQENGKPQRSWPENVRIRGTAILLKMIGPILHDRGDEQGRATKARIREIVRSPHDEFTFILEIFADVERGRLIGPKCRNLSALQVLFSAALTDTFRRDERPRVTVGIWDEANERVLMPQRICVESELEPEEGKGR